MFTTPVTGVREEYVADDVDLSTLDVGMVFTSPEQAMPYLHDYLTRRVRAVLDDHPGRPVLLLSSGIDSTLLAGYVHAQAPDALAVTYVAPGTGVPEQAVQVAQHFGFEHVVVEPSLTEFQEVMADLRRRLDTTDPWEVLAAVPWRVCEMVVTSRGLGGDSAMITGVGADPLFLGEDVESEELKDPAVWRARVVERAGRDMSRTGFPITDFYDRVLDHPDRLIKVWATRAATELALAQSFESVRGMVGVSKYVFRLMAQRLELPWELTIAAKVSMQESSGGFSAMEDAARSWLTDRFYSHYTSAETDTPDKIIAALLLHAMAAEGGEPEV